MALLATLKKDRLGDWTTLADFAADLRRRETAALAALSNALGASADEQRELLASVDVLVEVAGDLRVPKGARLSAARCAIECGVSGEQLARLFAGAGDLATDPRLGAAARRLVETGLPAALQAGIGREVSPEAASFARAVHAAGSAVGKDRVGELLGGAAAEHAGAAAGRFALGLSDLPDEHRGAWRKLLVESCSAFKRAPAAARRLGLAPQWPPNLPDAFAPLVAEAEAATAGISAVEAAARPPRSGISPRAPAPAQPAVASAPQPGTGSAPAPRPSAAAARGVQEVGTKRLSPPIRQAPARRPIGTVVERPAPAAPRRMPPIGRPPQRDGGVPDGAKPAPLPGLAPLPSRDAQELRYGPDGRRIPRPDRWNTDEWQWETPVLPPSTLPPPRRAAVAAGPFAARLQSVFDDRPEAVERLCAAVEARSAAGGAAAALEDLRRELDRWRDRTLPREQVVRLRATAAHAGHPDVWRTAAALLLERLRGGDFFL